MSENSSGGAATPWLAFLVGGLVVIVAVIAFAVYSGRPSETRTVDLNIKAPAPAAAPAAPTAG